MLQSNLCQYLIKLLDNILTIIYVHVSYSTIKSNDPITRVLSDCFRVTNVSIFVVVVCNFRIGTLFMSLIGNDNCSESFDYHVVVVVELNTFIL
jgi:hypothetical protein